MIETSKNQWVSFCLNGLDLNGWSVNIDNVYEIILT